MYDNICSLKLLLPPGGVETVALGMVSAEGEVMQFDKEVKADGRVEDWMTSVVKEMQRTNRHITKEGIYYYCHQQNRYLDCHKQTFFTLISRNHVAVPCDCRTDWMRKYQGMVCLAANQVWWTWEMEDTFNKMKKLKIKSALKEFAKKQHRQIDELVLKV